MTLVGVHSSTWGDRYFSPLSRIYSDLGGSWTVAARPPASQTGPTSVYITGPDDVVSSSSCNLLYTAVTQGSHSINSYAWQTDGNVLTDAQSSGIRLSFPTPGNHWVQVTVTDDVGTQVTSNIFDVTASPTGMECYN